VPLRVRRAVAGDEPILRDLRLQALTYDPDTFTSTYARELARTRADWERWLSPGATFILETPDGAVGLVAGRRDDTAPAVVHLMAMWVQAAARGSGGADALVFALLEWAASEHATHVRLDVFQDNGRARRFYQRLGFLDTGDTSVGEADGRIEVRMERLVT
jgi:GNAT superfamily N-acetyltransferase